VPFRTRRIAALVLLLGAAAPLRAQETATRANSFVLVTGQEGSLPIPTLLNGAGHKDISEQLFLPLARLGPTLATTGERGFEPQLARSWSRRDSLTLVFELDPRARWHDGRPVTARDIAFTLDRARNPALAPRLAEVLRYIASVTAESERRVVVRFARYYPEQLYDVVYHVSPLPEHIVAAIPADKLAQSDFARTPVGNGPFRWVRLVPGEFIELAANPDFFLGRPRVQRFIARIVGDASARLNMLLSGEADATETVLPPLASLERIERDPALRIVRTPTFTVGYILFNQRDRADSSRPHPILGDADVRRALVMALDRERISRAAYGAYSRVPVGPVSQLLWIRDPSVKPVAYDTAGARRLLAARGWIDRDGDGVLDRDGRPLALTISIPNTSPVRLLMAPIAQEQWRQLGIQVNVDAMEFPRFLERRQGRDFDMDISSAQQDPSPTGLVQSWSCAGRAGSNVGSYCNPRIDSLIERARYSAGDTRPLWNDVISTITSDAPAAFLYAPTYATVVSRRFRNVHIRPEALWASVWQWSPGPVAGR
jgi:peptide/nickel transport system substrate-binding protein